MADEIYRSLATRRLLKFAIKKITDHIAAHHPMLTPYVEGLYKTCLEKYGLEVHLPSDPQNIAAGVQGNR